MSLNATPNPTRCAVIGAGSFGTCLSILLAEKDCAVDLWARDPSVAQAINRHHRNPRYLKELLLPERVRATASLEEALRDKEVVLSVLPSHGVREVWSQAARFIEPEALIITASKGIEVGTGKLMHQVLEETLDPSCHRRIVVLSGPSFAREISERRPTAVTVASKDEAFAIAAQSMLSSPIFKCYSNTDLLGVELGGALKNVIAIAIGISDGMEMGLNARATLITRGLREMTRLGVHMGADPLTFLGLSGIGDLILTCTGDLSRNRSVGLEIGRGKGVADVLGSLTQVAEGVKTAESAYRLSVERDVDMPITKGVYEVLYEGKDFREAARDLISRQLKSEAE
jgi:glycerol-3-phosphate dehydrogenase (NAD(P)+)